ncbi:alkaline phosphatase family protein [Vibrio sp. CAIM 722]|uniref:Alkaline phosphatase family protein n=1 Tax=Vibrio eleionomae TaxID=2653505 RepID=A0A7X4RVX1_9VIBR|nr:alkaline phosphatase D family protein [Vibrio eleionomae]MZI95421.1 alkaline phosphatase family protein [Vibrio eleionomae]
MPQDHSPSLPLLLAGPIIRKCSSDEVVIWLATSEPLQGNVELFSRSSSDEQSQQQTPFFSASIEETVETAYPNRFQIGSKAWIYLLRLPSQLTPDTHYYYDINTQHAPLSQLYPHLCYEGEAKPYFRFTGRADYILHGSCRNPHDPCKDALHTVSKKVAQQLPHERPDLFMMSGDQIYADHVAGPMLAAIHRVISELGLYDETFDKADFTDSKALYQHPSSYYGRKNLLPTFDAQNTPLKGGKNRAIFTSTDSDNHLISFAEFAAMYLLVWSPTLWDNLSLLESQHYRTIFESLPSATQQEWQTEWSALNQFYRGLHDIQRMLAHLPTYMIFDDHDVTDDWNLTAGWEYAAMHQPLAKRIIGNALMGYWFFQGWGNCPEQFDNEFFATVKQYAHQPTKEHHDQFIANLYDYEHWHYTTDTSPKMIVLDTRTQRWRSESNLNRPSGLMDWEALMELQQNILHQEKVLIVSAAPIFGVKFIETLQRIMTWFGKPLMVDAENWMAHPGSANTLLSIFTHSKTPTNYVILSGDVHYSFAYDIHLRSRKSSPNIFQITCSGFKNQFPEPLLTLCDYADTLLYSPRSPLNWFTKRKRLKIRKRHPDQEKYRHLVNSAAVGELKLDKEGKPSYVGIITSSGREVVFAPTVPK